MIPDPLVLEMAAARRRKNLTQADVAEALGTSRTTVTNWEIGTASPRLEDFLRWAAVVDMIILAVPRSAVEQQTQRVD